MEQRDGRRVYRHEKNERGEERKEGETRSQRDLSVSGLINSYGEVNINLDSNSVTCEQSRSPPIATTFFPIGSLISLPPFFFVRIEITDPRPPTGQGELVLATFLEYFILGGRKKFSQLDRGDRFEMIRDLEIIGLIREKEISRRDGLNTKEYYPCTRTNSNSRQKNRNESPVGNSSSLLIRYNNVYDSCTPTPSIFAGMI